MTDSTWRAVAAPVIADVVAREGRDDVKRLRKALHDAYPFGERKYWPYKVWLSEIHNQLGYFGPRDDRRTMDMFS